MPLSEHEQRLLDQIERALYAEDPKFASTVRSTDLRTHMRRRLLRAAVVFVLGFLLLPVGVVQKSWVLGAVGFVIMVVALVLALSAWKRLSPGGTARSDDPRGDAPRGGGSAPRSRRRPQERGPAPEGGWRGRVEERWKRRWDERGEQG